MIDPHVKRFIDVIGARELVGNDYKNSLFRQNFKRHNYFVLNGQFLIVKISRSKKPFWGVGKNFINLFNNYDNYYLILLVSSYEGWVFSKADINQRIASGAWKLRSADNNYKINWPLPDMNAFFGKIGFEKQLSSLKRLG